MPNSYNNLERNIVCLVYVNKIIYSASIDDVAIIFRFLDYYVIGLLVSMKTFPVVNRPFS